MHEAKPALLGVAEIRTLTFDSGMLTEASFQRSDVFNLRSFSFWMPYMASIRLHEEREFGIGTCYGAHLGSRSCRVPRSRPFLCGRLRRQTRLGDLYQHDGVPGVPNRNSHTLEGAKLRSGLTFLFLQASVFALGVSLWKVWRHVGVPLDGIVTSMLKHLYRSFCYLHDMTLGTGLDRTPQSLIHVSGMFGMLWHHRTSPCLAN